MVGRPSSESGPERQHVGRRRSAVHCSGRRSFSALTWLVATLMSLPAWADAGAPPAEQPAAEQPSPEQQSEESFVAPEPDPEEVEGLVQVPEEQEELLTEEEPPPPRPAMPPPPRFGQPPIRFNHNEEPAAPTRVETADGVTMLSNRHAGENPQPEAADHRSPEGPEDPPRDPSGEASAADTPTMAVVTNSQPLARAVSKRKKDGDDEKVEGLGWLWLLVGAAGLLLVPIGVLLNRGARRQTSVPPSRG